MNLRNPLLAGEEACNQGVHSGFETSPEVQNGYQWVAPRKWLISCKRIFCIYTIHTWFWYPVCVLTLCRPTFHINRPAQGYGFFNVSFIKHYDTIWTRFSHRISAERWTLGVCGFFLLIYEVVDAEIFVLMSVMSLASTHTNNTRLLNRSRSRCLLPHRCVLPTAGRLPDP